MKTIKLKVICISFMLMLSIKMMSQNNQNVQMVIPQNIMIHTFDDSRVERENFNKYTNWYDECGLPLNWAI